MIAEILDQVLHVWWFFCLAVVLGLRRDASLSWVLVVASFTILPRELIDQWHGWPIGAWKLVDIYFCYLGAFLGWWVRRT